MSSAATISVVIPCYNAAPYIGATLRSVFAQQWPTLEVLVVDDGSQDGSAELVEREFPQVRVLRQRNQGVAVARNTGIRAASGRWIAFVDADDIWLPGKLQAQWDLLQANPGARISYTAWQVWDSSTAEPGADYIAALQARADEARWQGASGWIYHRLLLECSVWTSTVLAERSLFDEIGLFDAELKLGEDYDLWLRVSRVSPILRVPRPLALYRTHAQGITKRPHDTNYQALVISRAIERWGYTNVEGPDADRREVVRGLARNWTFFAATHLQAGDTRAALASCRHALRRNPMELAAWKLMLKAALFSLKP
ncbi:glycosyltransferase [Roseateles sp. DAIF2]|uniref:glycosyltransferase family 2 protein n=1 Tax=Roseateles sp. DAIF2 TaxID=2714952 RepID=UPI0018A2FD66|nr:glycosyltransferase [Roseateles sp. DAIF2]QPF73708.1 glycosyltransferase [Roseateles sp. DAIF2]